MRQRWATVALVSGAILTAVVICIPNIWRTQLPKHEMAVGQSAAYVSGAGGGAGDRLVTRNGPAKMAALPVSEGVVGGVPGGQWEQRSEVHEGRRQMLAKSFAQPISTWLSPGRWMR
jgi:hypothetical protein